MLWNQFVLLLTVFLVEQGIAKLVPDFIHPCAIDDNPCLLQSTRDALPYFVNGLPDLGVPVLDPFEIRKLTLPMAGIQASLHNAKMYGFRKISVDSVENNYKKHLFRMAFHGNMTLKGFYKAEGRILMFPINGDGEAKIKLTNLRMKITINTPIVPDKDGVKHFTASNFTYTFDYGDKATFNLTNLFKGSPELSNTIMTFINENWRLVAEEFGKPIVELATEMVMRTIEKFFLAVPFEELIDGPLPSFNELSN